MSEREILQGILYALQDLEKRLRHQAEHEREVNNTLLLIVRILQHQERLLRKIDGEVHPELRTLGAVVTVLK